MKQVHVVLGIAAVRGALLAGASAVLTLTPSDLAQAQSTDAAQPPQVESGVGALTGDIVVTARKRTEDVQHVPLAITAFGAKQLQVLNYRDMKSLSTTMPNVSFEENGTFKGYANFAIRGLGTNSSTPSIDPSVGMFVDGVYQGSNVGQVLDQFDLEAIEVLRGPQGVLFGRNVTGGAVLIRTRMPTDTFDFRGRVALESGLRVVTDATVSGPIADGLTAKLAAYYTHDNGYFHNSYNNKSLGKDEQYVIRPALRYHPNSDVDVLLRFEHGKQTGDGPADRNLALAPEDSFYVDINEPGYVLNEWTSATLETNIGVGFGSGKITNIFGWRKLRSDSLGDIDGTPMTTFHIQYLTDQRQFSDELRYAGKFGRFDVTTGLYAFTQHLHYVEHRILTTPDRYGGGEGTFDTLGAFAAVDWHLTDTITVNSGVRYSYEYKKAAIATVRVGGGDVDTRSIIPDFYGHKSWRDVTPRIGVQYQPMRDLQAYAFYTKGFRSGNYNFRITVPGVSPGPTNPEQLKSYEIGLKFSLPNHGGNINFAAFHNEIDHIQRNIYTAVAGVGSSQQLANAGTAVVKGLEGEANLRVLSNLVISGQFGYLHGDYTKVTFDLNGDGVINALDYRLKLPQLAPWTYGASINYDLPLGSFGTLSNRLSYSHRDQVFALDNNLGTLRSLNMIDFNVALHPTGSRWTLSVYGTNMLNVAYSGNGSRNADTPAYGGDGPGGPLPIPSFTPLSRGRVVGAELRYQM